MQLVLSSTKGIKQGEMTDRSSLSEEVKHEQRLDNRRSHLVQDLKTTCFRVSRGNSKYEGSEDELGLSEEQEEDQSDCNV